MAHSPSFVRGTVILTVSAFITRMLGFINSVVLARYLGPEGIGLLMMAHPLVPIVITLTGLGLPVAISKLVAEAEAAGDKTKVRQILLVSLTITGTISVLLTVFTMFGARTIASWYLSDSRAYYAMLAIIPITPLVAISSVLKGYFRGKQNMKPLAFSEVIEQVIRIALITALVQLLMPYGIEYAAAGAMICTVIGEASGLLYLILTFAVHRKKLQAEGESRLTPRLKEERRTLGELMYIGLPTTGHGFLSSMYRAFQPVLITKSLAIAGISTAVATKQFGLLAGCTFPLLMFPSFIMHSLSTALVPAIAEAYAGSKERLVQLRLDQAMRIALMVGAPSTLLLYVWAVPLTTLIYHSPEAGYFLRLLAPIFFLQYFDPPLHAVLLGLGKVNAVMWNFVVSTIGKAAAIFLLGSQYGMTGVVWGINVGIILITLLNFRSISRCIGLYVDMRENMKVAVSLVTMVICGQSMFLFLQRAGMHLGWAVSGSMLAALLVYVLTLLVTSAVKPADMHRIPGLGRLLS